MVNDPALLKIRENFENKPEDEESFHILEESYFMANAWEELIKIYSIRIRAIEQKSPKETAQLYFRQGEFYEKRLGKPQNAYQAYKQSYQLDSDNEEYLQSTIRVGEGIEAWEELVEVLIDKSKRIKSPSDQAAILFQTAGYQRSKLKNNEQAKKTLWQALKVDETCSKAAKMLERILVSEKSWDSLAELYDFQCRLEKSSEQKIHLLRKCANLYEEKLQYIPKAIEYYRKIVELAANDSKALNSLEALYTLSEQWDKVIEIMERQLKLLNDKPEKIRLLMSMALIWSEKIQDLGSATKCYERALELQEDPIILEILEESYSFQENWTALADILEKRSRQASDSEEKKNFFLNLAQLWEDKLQNKNKATHWYQAAFQESPQEAVILENLKRLLKELDKIEELLAVYRKELAWVNKNQKLVLYGEMAQALIDRKQNKEAAEIFEEALSVFPKNLELYDNLIELYQGLQSYDKLLHVYSGKGELLDKKGKIDCFGKMAKLLKENLEREREAIAQYKKILELQPDNLEVLRILQEYYEREQAYQPLIETTKTIAKIAPNSALKGYLDIARIQWEKLKEVDNAIQSYKTVLKINACYIEAWKAVRALYKHKKDWKNYLNSCQSLLELISAVEEKIAVHYDFIDVYSKQNKMKKVIFHLQEVLQLEPAHAQTILQLKKIYAEQENWQSLVDILIREAEHLPVENNITLNAQYREIALLYQKQLKNVKKSISYFEKARSTDPHNSETLDALENLYQSDGNFKKLIAILQMKARLCEEKEQKVSFLYWTGVVYEEQLENTADALLSYRKVLEQQYDHEQALERIEQIYRDAKQLEELGQFYDSHVKQVMTDELAIELRIKAARLEQEHLQKPERAIEHYLAVIKLRNNHQEALDSLLDLYRLQQNWSELARIYEWKIGVTKDKEQNKNDLYELATVYHRKLERPQRAFHTYHKLLSLAPKNLKGIMALEELCREQENWQELSETLERKVILTSKEEQQWQIWQELGKIHTEKTFQLEKAIESYRQALKLSSNKAEWRALHELYHKTADYHSLVPIIEQRLKIAEEEEKTLLLHELAEICNRLNDDAKASNALHEILGKNPKDRKAFDNLSDIYQNQKDYRGLVDLWESQLYELDWETQKEISVNMAYLLSHELQEDDRALEVLQQTLEMDPDYLPARDALAGYYRKHQKWEKLIELLEEDTSRSEKPAEIHRKIAHIWHYHKKNYDKALIFYQKSLEIESTNLATIKHIEDIYREKQQWNEWIDACEKELAVETIDKARKISLLLKIAELQEWTLQLPDQAEKNYYAVLVDELDKNNLEAIRGLQRIHRQSSQYEKLQKMLLRELEIQKESERCVALLQEIADLKENKLGDTEGAHQFFEQAYEQRPGSLEIIHRLKSLSKQLKNDLRYAQLVENEITLLEDPACIVSLRNELITIYYDLKEFEKAIEHGKTILELDSGHIDTIHALEQLYTEQEQYEPLADIYLHEGKIIADSDDIDRKVFVFHQAGLLYNDLEKIDEAIICLQNVIQANIKHVEARDQLIELLTKKERWQELIDLFLLILPHLEKNQKCEVHLKTATIYRKNLEDLANAFIHYQIAFQLHAKNPAAVQGMRRILEKEEKWQQALEMLAEEAKLIEEQKRPGLYYKMGEIWEEKVKIPHRAIDAYNQVMEYTFHRPTVTRLVLLFEKIGDWKGLADILEKDVRATNLKSEELPQKLLHLGEIYWQKLKNLEDAIRVYTAALKLDNKNETALSAMEQLLEKQRQWSPLVAILKQRLQNIQEAQEQDTENSSEKTDNPDHCYRLQMKIAAIYRDNLHSGDQAIIYYEQALEHKPKSLETIHALQGLYREWGCYQKLVKIHKREISLVEDQNRLIELYHEMGEAWEKRLFSSNKAIETYSKLMSIAADIDAARTIVDIYRRCELWEKLPEIYNTLLEDARKKNELEEEINIHVALGELYRKELDDVEKAIEHYQKVLELELLHQEAFQALEQLYEKENRMAELVDLLEEKVRLVTDPDNMLGIQLKLGHLYEKQMDQPEKAIECFNKANIIAEDNIEALQALHRLYMTTESWERLAEIVKQELSFVADVKEKAELCFLLGNLLREQFDDLEGSRNYFLQAIEYIPAHVPSLLELSQIAMGQQNWEQAVRYIELADEHTEAPEKKVGLLNNLGKLYREKLDQVDRARNAYLKTLQIKPEARDPLEAICEIYYQAEQWTDLEPMLARFIGIIEESDKNSHWHYRWGRCAEATERDTEAIGRYSKAMEMASEYPDPVLALGNIYWRRKEINEAFDIYRKASSLPNIDDRAKILHRLGIASEKLQKFPLAIQYYEEFLQTSEETPVQVLHSLSGLYIEKKDFTRSKYFIEQIISGEWGVEDKCIALKRKAYIHANTNFPEKAIAAYTELLELNPKDLTIACEMAKLHMELQNWEQAAHWNQKHYETIEQDDLRVENRLIQSRILWEGLKDHHAAISCYREALAIDSLCMQAIQGIATIHILQKDWQKVIESYQDFLDHLPQDKPKLSFPIHIALGNLYKDEIKEGRKAIEHFEKALAIEPEHMEAQISVTELKSQDPQLRQDAIQGHRALLRRDPFRSASYRALFRLLYEEGDSDFATRAYRAMRVLTPDEKQTDDFDIPWAPQTPSSILENVVTKYLIPSRIQPLRELMALTGEYHERTYLPDLEKKYGVRKKEHLAVESVQKPVWYYTNKIMQMLGIKDLHMYITNQATDKIFVENTNPPSLLVSQSLVNQLSEEEMRFLIAKYLFYIYQKQSLAAKLTPDEVKIYFFIMRSQFSTVKQALTPEAEVLQKKLHANIPWKLRKPLKNNTELWEQVANASVAQYLKCLEYSSNRMGLLVCDSLELAVKMIYNIERWKQGKTFEKSPTPSMDQLKHIDGIGDLLLFNISEQYGKLRKECGLA